MREYKLFINNEWVDSSSGETFITSCPATGETLARLAKADSSDVDKACKAARAAFESGVWSEMENEDRAEILLKAADLIESRMDEFVELETLDTGKAITEVSSNDIPLSIRALRYFGNLAREINGEYVSIPFEKNIQDYFVYEPYGVVAVISPYNFPLHLLTRSLAPALAAGNTTVCKASSLTPITTSLLGEIVLEAGFPPGVVNIVSGSGQVAGEALASHRDVDIIAFTGSETVGRRLMELSASSEVIKKTLLELGGKGPAIVEPDCNINASVDAMATGFCYNQGQVCAAYTKLLLHEEIYDEFLEKLVEKVSHIRIGDILDPETEMGGMVSENQLNQADAAVKEAVKAGATLLCGGERITEPPLDTGCFYKPTILTNVDAHMPCYHNEVFGPVLVVKKYKDLDEAVRLSNETHYGLGAAIFTEDHRKAYWLSKKLNAGTIYTNITVTAKMNAPFGGNKNSGFGREYGVVGLHEYLKIKNNIIDMSFGVQEA